MTSRSALVKRETLETHIKVQLDLDAQTKGTISTGIPFLDHMLILLAAHGFMGLTIEASGDLAVDFHHTVEDVGLVLGDAFNRSLGERQGIIRYGHAVTPMDDALAAVTVDLSNRPYLVFNLPPLINSIRNFDAPLAKEFFRAFVNRAGLNLHVNVAYGENDHHVLESIFKATGRALHIASRLDRRSSGIRSTKGCL